MQYLKFKESKLFQANKANYKLSIIHENYKHLTEKSAEENSLLTSYTNNSFIYKQKSRKTVTRNDL